MGGRAHVRGHLEGVLVHASTATQVDPPTTRGDQHPDAPVMTDRNFRPPTTGALGGVSGQLGGTDWHWVRDMGLRNFRPCPVGSTAGGDTRTSGSAAASGDWYVAARPSFASFNCRSIDELHVTSALAALAALSLTKRL